MRIVKTRAIPGKKLRRGTTNKPTVEMECITENLLNVDSLIPFFSVYTP